mgnify:FL=1
MSFIFEHKIPTEYRNAFLTKAMEVARDLGIPVNWLLGVIELETAGTFSPSITNSIGATGLIQFMPSTALGLGTTTARLRQMSAVDQLDYVKKYYWPYRSKIKQYADLYIATLFPVAIGKPNDYVLQTKSLSAKKIAAANPLFDLDKNQEITVGEIRHKVLQRIPEELLDLVLQKKNPNWIVRNISRFKLGGRLLNSPQKKARK